MIEPLPESASDALLALPLPVVWLSPAGKLRGGNAAAAALLGAELAGRPLSAYLDGPDHRLLRAALSLCDGTAVAIRLRDGTRVTFQCALGRPDAEGASIVATLCPIPGDPSAEELGAVVDHVTSPVFVHDRGRVVHANRVGRELLGQHQRLDALLDEGDARAARSLWAAVQRRRQAAFSVMTVRFAGARSSVRATHLPLRFEGRPRVATVLQEVQGLLALREELARTQRLTTVGTLAAGVAHEINNPLAYIVGNIVYVDDLLADDEPIDAAARQHAREALTEALEGTHRVGEIVRQLNTLTRKVNRREPVSLGKVVDQALSVAGRTLAGVCAVERDVQPTRAVFGNEAQVFQITLNLLMNAAQSFPEGEPPGAVVVRVQEGSNGVCLEVRDNGCGMSEETLEQAFVPFFTARPSGDGTGLGLSIVDRIARDHGGRIQIDSAVGEGTRVRVWFPPVEVAREAKPVEASPSAHPTPVPAGDDDLETMGTQTT